MKATNYLISGLAGGVIALVWILYKRKKAKNGSQMIKNAMENGTSDGSISVSDGDKRTSEQDDPKISTGAMPMPTKPYPIKPTLPPIKPSRVKGELIGITI